MLRFRSGRPGESEERASEIPFCGGRRNRRRLGGLRKGIEQCHQSRSHRHLSSRSDADLALTDPDLLSPSAHADRRHSTSNLDPSRRRNAHSRPDRTDSGGHGHAATDSDPGPHRAADRDAVSVPDPESHLDFSDPDADLPDPDTDLPNADCSAEPDFHFLHSHSLALEFPA